jgi:hypothetical protein
VTAWTGTVTFTDATLDVALDADAYRANVLAELRAYAKSLAEAKGEPISVNDIRPYFESMGYEGDTRIMGSVFRRRDGWIAVGQELGTSETSHPGPLVRRWRLA